MPNSIESFVGLAILLATPFAFIFYKKVLDRIRSEGGKVRKDWVDLPDIAVALVIGGYLVGTALDGFLAPPKETQIRPEQIVPAMIVILILVLGLVLFLSIRRVGVSELFGLRRLALLEILLRGTGMLLAALPVLYAVQVLTLFLLKDKAQPQDLVALFSSTVRSGDIATIAKILITGVLVAPVCEEILFRGYFYPVAKRYFGPITGAFVVAALFAASHVNLASFGSLMGLALCFTMAYERTGSLLVSICMHAAFNGFNLAVLYLAVRLSH